MAQTLQIVPKWSFPHIESYINDYTVVVDDAIPVFANEPLIRYIYAFVSSKGLDNRFVRLRGRRAIANAYGETNFKKYGQPLMQALDCASQSDELEIACMRVMPENATYAYNIISAFFKGDSGEGAGAVANASERKFRIKFVQRLADEDVAITTKEALAEEAKKSDSGKVVYGYEDSEGYTQAPGFLTIRCAGRGKYGNSYRLRVNQNIPYEKDYGIKFYNFEILNVETGFTKDANYVGCMVTSPKYNEETLINDVLEDRDDGVVPVFVNVNEDSMQMVYDAYVAWLAELLPDLEEELAEIVSTSDIDDDVLNGLKEADEEDKATMEKINDIQEKIEIASNPPDFDEFDIFFGRDVASSNENPLIKYIEYKSADIDENADGYNEADYSEDDIVSFESVSGIRIFNGADGYFDNPRMDVRINPATGEEEEYQWTVEQEIEECYNNAYSGVYDSRILTSRRIGATAIFDANYPYSVKNTLADLTAVRNDCLFFMDTGILSSFGKMDLQQLIDDYSVFTDNKISKNLHYYYIKEPTSKKRVPVTITYFLSMMYVNHIINNGQYIPFVKANCQLAGHVKDSLYPSIEDYETDLKETLYDNRINYFETVGDNVYQRGTQNTAQEELSDLLEENNVATLYNIKRILENDVLDSLYDFSDPETRARFREFELAKFADYEGREVESIDILFSMNAWEAERSILHAYVSITFRGLQKIGILEFDINKRDNADA